MSKKIDTIEFALYECDHCGTTTMDKPQDPPCVYMRPSRFVTDVGRKNNWPCCPFGGKAKWRFKYDTYYTYNGGLIGVQ